MIGFTLWDALDSFGSLNLMSPRRLAKLLAWFGSGVLGAVLIVSIWVVRHRTGEQLIKEAASVVPGSVLSARNFHWTQMKGAQKQWELVAERANFSDDRKSLRLVDADLSMVSEDGKLVTMHAPVADLKMIGNHVNRADLSGGLKVHYGDAIITTQQAAFIPDADELTVPGLVTIESVGLKITGVGLTAHPHAQLFDLHQQINTEVTPKRHAPETGKAL
jgi:LPS export ABC transporter protein LptC